MNNFTFGDIVIVEENFICVTISFKVGYFS